MASQLLTYEFPLNERMRTLLRVEFLFQQFMHDVKLNHAWQTRSAIHGLMDIVNLLERTDLANELIKEMDRQLAHLQRLSNTPAINRATLTGVMDKLQFYIKFLQPIASRLDQPFTENEFLNSIRQRQSIPGGTCSFDLPQYHYWLNLNYETRLETLNNWLGPIKTLQEAVVYLLGLIRQSGVAKTEIAQGGLFQKSLNPVHPTQLIRIGLNYHSNLHPELSGSKHRISMRMLTTDLEKGSSSQTKEDIQFELTCCAI
jgi:cell division protein ZapD